MPNQTSAAITPTPTPADSLTLQITAASLGRFVINTSRRFVYPFAPALSRGLGVPLTSITSLIALNQLTGILSPVFGPLSDRWGYKVMMVTGLGLLTSGMLAAGFLPFYSVLLLAVFVGGVGKSIFDPALQAYIGERVPYERRGSVIGLIEMSWAGASLVGIPAAGFLIDRFNWQAPFFVLGGLGLLLVAILGFILPNRSTQSRPAQLTDFRQAWHLLRNERAALGMLGFAFFSGLSNDALFVVYGAWLEGKFGLSLVALGTVTIVIGIAELGGETLTATLSDRLGPKRSVQIGQSCVVLGYLLIPLISFTLPLAMASLFILFLAFEFTIVTNVSLNTEILPKARATMVSSSIAASGLGRVVGALIGGPIWLWGGIGATGLVAAVSSAVGLTFFLWGLHRWRV